MYFTQGLCNFSFYAFKSIFVLYAINQYAFNEADAIVLFSTFMSLCYAASLIGGTLADRGLGLKNSVITGGVLSIAGLLCFLLPYQDGCLLGLSLLTLGSGFFKPNLATAVGAFFADPKDAKKDEAYSVSYMALNLGSLLGPLLCGYICKSYDWNLGIGLISLSFFAATFIFYKNVIFNTKTDKKMPVSENSFLLVGITLILLVPPLYLLLKYRASFHGLMGIIAVTSCVYFGKVYYQATLQERKDISRIVFYILAFAVFCSLFEQAGSSLILFFEKGVDRHFFGNEVPSSLFLSLGPLFVLFVIPALMHFSKYAFKHSKSITGILKLSLGFLCFGLSFWILAWSAYKSSSLVPAGWIILFVFIQTLGEVLIVPIGLSNISKFAPLRFRSLMMSFWLMAISYGHYFAGFIAQLSLKDSTNQAGTALERYGDFFFDIGWIPIAASILLMILSFMRKRLVKQG